MPEEEFVLESNGQLTFHSLKVGAAGIKPVKTEQGVGVEPPALSVGLWLYYREDPSQDQAVRLAKGESIEVAGYRVDVVDLSLEGRGLAKLRVRKPEQAAAPSS